MGMKIEGFEETKIYLQAKVEEASSTAMTTLLEVAKDIQTLAKKMAPIDYGNLEEAIKLRTTGGLVRNKRGHFVGGGGATIYVDNEMVAEQPGSHRKEQVVVGDYAWFIHEHLTPYGSLRLGKLSQEKQDADPSVQVGGGFMDRAAAEASKELLPLMAKAVAKRIAGKSTSEE